MSKMKLPLFFLVFFFTSGLLLAKEYNSNMAVGGKEGVTMEGYQDLGGGPPISQIGFRASGGRSSVEEYGIVVREHPDKIVIRSFEKWRRENNGFDRQATLSKQEYESLWKEAEKFNIWQQDDSVPSYSDGFVYEFTFSKNGKTHKVYAGEVGILDNVARLLDSLAYSKLGVKLYKE